MKNLYAKNTANFPRLNTDCFFVNYSNTYSYSGIINDSINFIENFQLLDKALWKRFVIQFKEHSDKNYGWRGEFWGKMMRGACFIYSYTNNSKLYDILSFTVNDMLSAQEKSGRISSYPLEIEFDGWDIWCRKYVLLGMQYFLEICKDEALYKNVISSMCQQVDYIMQYIGKDKKPITKATKNWRGLNSSSLLEPIVRLYSLTDDKKYLNFAKYIVDEGGIEIENIFELSFKNELYPYQYPMVKAYEMISCFEGLLEYYRISGDEKHKISVINFADKILESDFTVIGSCGCTHELFDHSTVRQANTTNDSTMQETCVTVTIMKFLYQVYLITGNLKYIDAFETSLYNAYLGSFNTEKIINKHIVSKHPELIAKPMPFDSYSPLTAQKRGNLIGGFMIMSDNHYYGCCACIGSVGIGLVPKLQLITSKNGLAVNLFINGKASSKTPSNKDITITTKTDYPKSSNVILTISIEESEKFTLLIRNPEWSENTVISVNGQAVFTQKGYISLDRVWNNGDRIDISFDMPVKVIKPITYGHQILMTNLDWNADYAVPTFDREDPLAHKHIALKRGPIMLAQENRLGYNIDNPIEIKINNDDTVSAIIPSENTAPYPSILELQIPLKNGANMTVTDYASAGKLWNKESKMAVWMLTN